MPRALIAGAGIGGLSCGIALARAGWQVQIFEQAANLSEIGAGVQLGPNATRILDHWNLLPALRQSAFKPAALCARDWRSGQVLNRSPLNADSAADGGSPYLQLHRADLQAVLRSALESLAGTQLLLDHPVDGVDPDTASLSCGGRIFRGDLVVGADGIRSTLRHLLFSDSATRYTGQSAWRLMLPANRLPAGLIPPETSLWMGPGRHLVHYYVRGGQLVNVVGVVEQPDWTPANWVEAADFAELQADFRGAHPDIQALIAAAESLPCYRWALHDRAPMPQWYRARALLLGDACHPTLPFLAQGAAMAIEDAAVLAGELARSADIEAALQRYQERRQPRTRWVQQASRRNARIFHLRGVAAGLRNWTMRHGLAGPGRLTRRLYEHDVLHPGARD